MAWHDITTDTNLVDITWDEGDSFNVLDGAIFTIDSVFSKKFDTISKTLEKLVAVDVEIQNLHKNLNRCYIRVEKIEQLQNNIGCNILKTFIATREQYITRLKKVEKTVDDIKDIPNKLMMRAGFVAISVLVTGVIGVLFYMKVK